MQEFLEINLVMVLSFEPFLIERMKQAQLKNNNLGVDLYDLVKQLILTLYYKLITH